MQRAAGEGALQLNETAVYADAKMQTEACAASLNALDTRPQQADMRYSAKMAKAGGADISLFEPCQHQ